MACHGSPSSDKLDDGIVVLCLVYTCSAAPTASIYVGWTSDLTTRLAQHQAGKVSKHTAARRPVVLIFHEEHVSSESAIARERQIKRWSRRKKQALVDGNLELLKQL
jgi:predicted GIY-YIG superfamily endonuclease